MKKPNSRRDDGKQTDKKRGKNTSEKKFFRSENKSQNQGNDDASADKEVKRKPASKGAKFNIYGRVNTHRTPGQFVRPENFDRSSGNKNTRTSSSPISYGGSNSSRKPRNTEWSDKPIRNSGSERVDKPSKYGKPDRSARPGKPERNSKFGRPFGNNTPRTSSSSFSYGRSDSRHKPENSGRSSHAERSERPERSDKRFERSNRSNSSERPERSDRPVRAERSDRPYSSDRPERAERPDRTNRPDRTDRSDRPDWTDSPARTERSDRPDKSQRPERSDRPVRAERSDRPNSTDRPERSDRPTRTERSDRPDRTDRPERSDRPDRSDRPYSSDRPARVERSDRPNSTDRPERSRPARAERPDRAANSDRPDRSERQARPERRDRPFNTDRPTRAERPARAERPDQPDSSDRPDRAERPERRSDSSERPERPLRAERTGRIERPGRGGRTEGSDRRPESSERPASSDRSTHSDSRRKPRINDRNAGVSQEIRAKKSSASANTETRLNKYIANAGICARRKADEIIAQGLIKVNGEVITEMGYKVKQGDRVQYQEKNLHPEEMIYVLLNKPKDFITTTDDPQERRTVMELISDASPYRIYPVGRLDRNTTGLLLFTNDGALAEKLSHPSKNILKLYHVSLDKTLNKVDMDKIIEGLELEDGKITIDEISYVEGESHKEIGIQIHSGKNRIVRRIFEHLGYEVVKLDRVIYAGLTKKDLTRGRWRHLTSQEVIQLKHFLR